MFLLALSASVVSIKGSEIEMTSIWKLIDYSGIINLFGQFEMNKMPTGRSNTWTSER